MDQKQYITKDSVRDMIMGWSGGFDYIEEPVEGALEDLRGIPTVDAAPVVRCKDCKWYQESKLLAPNKFCFRLKGKDGEKVGYNFADDDFCSHGERKGGTSDVCT